MAWVSIAARHASGFPKSGPGIIHIAASPRTIPEADTLMEQPGVAAAMEAAAWNGRHCKGHEAPTLNHGSLRPSSARRMDGVPRISMDRARKEYAMRSFHARGVASALVLASLATTALAQDAGMPSLLPLPPAYPAYPVTQTAATDMLWGHQETSPAPTPAEDLPNPSNKGEQSVIGHDYQNAMYGGYDGCEGGACGPAGCCNNFYVYGNVLFMTREKRGGFVTSIDSVTFEPRLFFCSPNFGDLWYGGFEVGGGWCLNGCQDPCGGCNSCCGTTALEVVYWGLFPDRHENGPTDPLLSMIDFADLNYNAANLNAIFDGAEMHRIQFGYDINSVEVQLVGNSMTGGPFGCGRTAGCGGPRFGFGWMAGFRYIDYSENFLFSTDFDDQTFDGDDDEAHYQVDLDNDLVGFQIGTGISYCVTQNIQAYALGRVGIYNNHVRQFQQIYGEAGPVTINNGPNTGEIFSVTSQKDELAVCGQFDFGARWNLNRSWSLDLGYRVVGLSGVAIAEDNVQQENFQNLEGIADIQTQGSVLLHGGYAGATYSW